jgi:hypothetical protein
LKESQDSGGIVRFGGDSCRVDVDDGLNGVDDGVNRALRFCVIESSIVLRERRRKSMERLGLVSAL